MKKLILFVVTLSFFIITIHLVNAFGMSVLPAFIRMNVIRGQQFDIPISVNNPGSEAAAYTFKAEDDIAKWVSFYNENKTLQINQITVLANGSNTFTARFNIPKNIANGDYSSFIYVETVAENTTSNNTGSLSIKVPITVSLDVSGSQFLTGKVINITTTDTEINRLVRIKVEFQNTGDVIATPRIEFAILKNGNEITHFVHNTTSVNVDNTGVIESSWDTIGQTVGDYIANVKVYLGDAVLKEESLDFKILERGTLTAEGRVEEVTANNEITSGQTARIEVQFQNTGDIDLMVKITGEVYQDDSLIDTLKSDETLVKIGENGTLTAYYKPSKDGSYLIRANVVYEGKKEPLNEIVIKVGNSNSFSFDAQTLILIVFVVFAVVLILIGMFKKSTKTKQKVMK